MRVCAYQPGAGAAGTVSSPGRASFSGPVNIEGERPKPDMYSSGDLLKIGPNEP